MQLIRGRDPKIAPIAQNTKYKRIKNISIETIKVKN